MFKINSKTYFIRHDNEIRRFINQNSKWIHIINKENDFKKFSGLQDNIFEIDVKEDTFNQLENIGESKYDLIVVTDVFEVTEDIFKFLNALNSMLNNNGKLIINSINPKWNFLLSIFEFLKLKKNSKLRSYIHHKKINSIAESSGFELSRSYTRQIFPFKFLGIGNFVNSFLEAILFKFRLGINNYLLFRKKEKIFKLETKTIIVPAKNEEKNLAPLISRIPEFKSDYEIIIICAKSKDKTLEEAYRIQQENKELDILVLEQKSKGKGPGVLEAINLSRYELITILDSDISVDPETLSDFFKIVESGRADFVNGTRFVYDMEKNAMKKLNHFGNIFFQFVISLVINIRLTDSLCGTKVFRRSSIEKLIAWGDNLKIKDPFGDFDFIFSASYSGDKILEYPVHYKARVYGNTQISRFSDGVKLLFYFINSYFIFNISKND